MSKVYGVKLSCGHYTIITIVAEGSTSLVGGSITCEECSKAIRYSEIVTMKLLSE